MKIQRLVAPVLLGALAVVGEAQQIGSALPDDVRLEDFAQTGAESYGDLFGRLVLIEFFAYW